MRSLNRQERIVQILLRRRSVQVSELAEELGVSGWSVRRDLNQLERKGLVGRAYGEARLLEGGPYDSFVPSEEARLEGKRRIAAAAARLVQPGQHVVLSAGSTTAEVARALRGRGTRCAVVTNALDIAAELSAERAIQVTCSGGEVDGDYRTLNGPIAERMLRGHFFDLAIIGVSGIALGEGLTVNSALNAVALSTMLEQSRRVAVAVDAGKFGRVRFAHLAPLEAVDVLITDQTPPPAFLERFATLGLELIVAAEDGGPLERADGG